MIQSSNPPILNPFQKRRKGNETSFFSAMINYRFYVNLQTRFMLFLFLSAFFACGKTKDAATAATGCKTQGTVVDYDGLDGCGYLIRLGNGQLLNPVVLPDGFNFKNNQSVRLDFHVLHDMASICMAESEMVEITCIQDAKQGNEPLDCGKITNPFAVAWMDKAIDRHNPVKIIRYQSGKLWLFVFQAVPNSFLYDCDGQLICESNGNAQDDCHRQQLNFLQRGKVIWQGEGVWD